MANGNDQDSEIIALEKWRNMPQAERDHYVYTTLRDVRTSIACVPGLREDVRRIKWVLGAIGALSLLVFGHILPDLLQLLRLGLIRP